MPFTEGISVRGLQRLGGFPSTGVEWELRFSSVPAQDRLNRVGTVIHCFPQSGGRFPVIQVYKLYAHGVRPPLITGLTYSTTEIWVNWFETGLSWRYTRPD